MLVATWSLANIRSTEPIPTDRIAYVDVLDAHHADGVFYAYEGDRDLIFADIHEDGRFLYPGTGRGSERGSGGAQARRLVRLDAS